MWRNMTGGWVDRRWRRAAYVSVAVLVLFASSLPAGVAQALALSPGERASSEPALVVLDDDGADDLTSVTESIEKVGGRVLHVFPPAAMIAHIPVGAERLAGVQGVYRHEVGEEDTVDLRPGVRGAAESWNELVAAEGSPKRDVHPRGLEADLVGDRMVPPPSSLLQANGGTDDPVPDITQTSEYMIGRVAVGIVLPQSDGRVDASTEEWTQEERDSVLSEITSALDWWARLEPRANLTFVYDDGTAAPVRTGYEPISRSYADQSLWISQIMDKKGYSGSSYFDQVRLYNQHLRSSYDTDWAFTIFVVDSSNDPDNRFADGHFAYAYVGGPFTVLTSGCNGYGSGNLAAVAAHEIGHIFHALDQYGAARQPCDRRSGYLGIENQNSQYGDCASDQPSIMRGQLSPFRRESLDEYARGQIGWRDSNGNGVLDPVDTSTEISDIEYVTDTTRSNIFTFTGQVVDAPYPSPLRSSVTINRIDAVHYRVAGNTWIEAEPVDGQFDSRREGFTFTTPPLPTGELEAEVRVTNSWGRVVTQTLASVSAVDPLEGVLETTLTRVGPQGMDEAPGQVRYHGHATSESGAFVAGVYYRIDEGPWEPVAASDGAFDEDQEDFTLTLSFDDFSPGEHTVEVHAEDGSGNVETTPARDVFLVTSPTVRVLLPLVLATP